MERIDLNDMRFFVATVQAGSLSRAAEQLNLPKSRLSRRLTELETALGSKLLDRGRNGVRLNELGEPFYRHAIMMLECADNAVNSVAQSLSTPRGLLRISLSSEVLRHCITPHLGQYLRRYPEVSLDIHMENRRINMIQDGIDIALRVGSPEQEDLVAKKVGEMTLGLYASVDYLHQNGIPQTPDQLAQHTLLHKSDGREWLFHQHGKSEKVNANKRVNANDAGLLAELVNDNIGIALLPEVGSLINPSWIKLLPDWTLDPVPLYAIYYKNRGFVPTVRSFVEFVAECLLLT
ncbi:LysR family transcriptional regulator [Testudinibacter sp. TR-2022]|uniref:LysR family transcriptional regulator n=1 Tax=Testudinibacter sp. TR-2022 TaxID=2585029 RepID=UPI00111916B8|nr:LysR family transcriptional regulator [Testudinibacter sp. TR-2022]TNH05060.1 LysR family transcriptional regulator [Pasteurellaceae bacterium Phil31]TNH10376.1 LysR family transcriptional regulator [Testudinibacter sp. TR-2022]TNH10673.1 LysR family transcriptional regulator [Testudinibacter sp. TR-2022]TNH17215.1 LysR family transcriptional regulator [Testudinibacter sp. TR-2022]TNH20777.1 LysR family transcriptional regulator [Testudinibacter sp. TR-2022]